jgi:hypothetical protein
MLLRVAGAWPGDRGIIGLPHGGEPRRAGREGRTGTASGNHAGSHALFIIASIVIGRFVACKLIRQTSLRLFPFQAQYTGTPSTTRIRPGHV